MTKQNEQVIQAKYGCLLPLVTDPDLWCVDGVLIMRRKSRRASEIWRTRHCRRCHTPLLTSTLACIAVRMQEFLGDFTDFPMLPCKMCTSLFGGISGRSCLTRSCRCDESDGSVWCDGLLNDNIYFLSFVEYLALLSGRGRDVRDLPSCGLNWGSQSEAEAAAAAILFDSWSSKLRLRVDNTLTYDVPPLLWWHISGFA